jgi:hypothetical protein
MAKYSAPVPQSDKCRVHDEFVIKTNGAEGNEMKRRNWKQNTCLI